MWTRIASPKSLLYESVVASTKMLSKIGEATTWAEVSAGWRSRNLWRTIRDRYQQASKKDKGRILDEFTAITGHHRKHDIRLMSGTAGNKGKQAEGRRIYDEAVREAVIVVWEASDRICSKWLKAALPNFVDSSWTQWSGMGI